MFTFISCWEKRRQKKRTKTKPFSIFLALFFGAQKKFEEKLIDLESIFIFPSFSFYVCFHFPHDLLVLFFFQKKEGDQKKQRQS
jgi:hypothetical protein